LLTQHTGWTWAQCEDLSLHQTAALYAQWRKAPPLQILVESLARYFGVLTADDKPARPPDSGQTDAEIEAEFARLSQANQP
jgi:hypothetical protein